MKTHKPLKRALSFFLCALLVVTGVLFPTLNVMGLTQEDEDKISSYKKQKEELDKKIEESKAKIDSMQGDLEKQKAYASELSAQISEYQDILDALEVDISKLEKEKSAIQEKIDELDGQIKKIELEINHNELEQIELNQHTEDIINDLKTCLCDLYVNGSTSDLELLFNSTDFSSFLILMELKSNMAKRDDELINSFNVDVAKLEELNTKKKGLITDLEEKKSVFDESKAELQKKQDVIIATRDEQKSAQDSIKALYNDSMAYVDKLDKESEAYRILIENYEAEKSEFEKKIDALVSSKPKGDGNVGSGGLIWPLQYSDAYISSPFGYRTDPFTGIRKFHGGTDTCCWSGTYGKNISAAASGVVEYASWAYGYGYYVVINHGNGVTTHYGHNSQILVYTGQKVTQGDVVALAGSTGNSTGAHCHFEVRVNGEKVSALNYCSP